VSETGTGVRCYILPLRGFPVETGSGDMALTRQPGTVSECLSRGLDVAPGVRIAVVATGGHYHAASGEMIYGTLVAVRTEATGE
jgi:hypothetical protein